MITQANKQKVYFQLINNPGHSVRNEIMFWHPILALSLSQILQIPEEEKNLGPQDRLIHVYHFTKESGQNQMVWFIDTSTTDFTWF